MSKRLYVGNISFKATEEDVKDLFSSAGEVVSVRLIKDAATGRLRGFGFVEMPGQTQAQTAIKGLDGKELQGKDMKVSEARPSTGGARPRGGRMEDNRRRNRY